ncbi:MAG TPA: type III pantothenate kinase [Acholeplasma sp.]|nr:type III pantothenate kinase [Acholeplasma sp.]
MILLIDVGNTTINMALSQNNRILKTAMINTNLNKTADEYYINLNILFELTKIKDIIISSVVPIVTKELVDLSKKHFKIDPLVIQQKVKTGVNVLTDNPREVGADLIAVAAALVQNNKSYLIIDLGTATKYIYVKNNAITGVIITPGVEVSIKALVGNTALLPNIDILVPRKVLGSNTIECMQSGVTYGTAAQVDGLIDTVKAEVKEDFEIVTTGGLAKVINPLIRHEIIDNPLLIFEGLLKIYNLNR